MEQRQKTSQYSDIVATINEIEMRGDTLFAKVTTHKAEFGGEIQQGETEIKFQSGNRSEQIKNQIENYVAKHIKFGKAAFEFNNARVVNGQIEASGFNKLTSGKVKRNDDDQIIEETLLTDKVVNVSRITMNDGRPKQEFKVMEPAQAIAVIGGEAVEEQQVQRFVDAAEKMTDESAKATMLGYAEEFKSASPIRKAELAVELMKNDEQNKYYNDLKYVVRVTDPSKEATRAGQATTVGTINGRIDNQRLGLAALREAHASNPNPSAYARQTSDILDAIERNERNDVIVEIIPQGVMYAAPSLKEVADDEKKMKKANKRADSFNLKAPSGYEHSVFLADTKLAVMQSSRHADYFFVNDVSSPVSMFGVKPAIEGREVFKASTVITPAIQAHEGMNQLFSQSALNDGEYYNQRNWEPKTAIDANKETKEGIDPQEASRNA